MPRPKSPVPGYRKHSSGQARTTINGRDFYLGPHGTVASKREYDRLVGEYLASGRSPSFGLDSDVYTIAMLICDYLEFAKGYYGQGKRSEYRNIVLTMKPLKLMYAALPAVEFGPEQFKAVRQRMIDHGCANRKRRDGSLIVVGCARSTANAHMRRIVRLFRWGASEAKLPARVYETLRIIPGLRQGRTTARETLPVKPVPSKVVAATLKFLPSTVADMVRLQLLLGCRPSEVCKLTPSMVDQSGDVWIATLDEHKTAHHGHKRTLYFGPQAQAIVQKYLDREPTAQLFRPSDTDAEVRARRELERVTPLKQGNRAGTNRRQEPKRKPSDLYSSIAFARAITRAAEKAGVEHWSPNRLRHSRATEVRSKFGLDAAAAILGHSEVGVTQVYAEQDRDKALQVARAIG